MQKTNVKNELLNISDYYRSLDKKEKAKLLNYLMRVFDFKYATLNTKLNGHREFNRRDAEVINKVIVHELWKQDRLNSSCHHRE